MADLSTILSQSTHLTDKRADGQTDGQTEFSSLDRVCIPCSAVIIVLYSQYECTVGGSALFIIMSIGTKPHLKREARGIRQG